MPEDMGLRLIIAILTVGGLLALMVVVLRTFGGKLGLVSITPANGQARLRILEAKLLDARHRLYLVSRDDKTEHLIILGGANPVVVESIDCKTKETQ
jgi:hypothetical protein